MNNTRFAGFSYEGLDNLGDHIQSICTERLLPGIEKRFNRDTLSLVADSAKYVVVMNGWFTHKPEYFPPSDIISPVFWGFHITNWNDFWDKILSHDCMNYLRTHSPIGCRDSFTQVCLNEIGIKSFYSKCLTLTLPKRTENPKKSWNIIVDVPIPLPQFIEDSSIRVSHSISPNISEKAKFAQAQKLLDLYRDSAGLIVTTRLHCALPAVAMGIPVVFLGNPDDYRISVLTDVGVKIHPYPTDTKDKEYNSKIKKLWSEINWEMPVIDFEKEKELLISKFNELLESKLNVMSR